MSNLYEHVPQRIGNAERDAAVQKLQVHLQEGRLDQATYDERVGTALAATTEDDLAPLFRDLPTTAQAPTYELYPNQTVATRPDPYAADPYPEPLHGPYQTPSFPTPYTAMRQSNVPKWLRIVFMVLMVAAVVGLFSHGWWWMIFVLPGVFGTWGGNNRIKNQRRPGGRG